MPCPRGPDAAALAAFFRVIFCGITRAPAFDPIVNGVDVNENSGTACANTNTAQTSGEETAEKSQPCEQDCDPAAPTRACKQAALSRPSSFVDQHALAAQLYGERSKGK
jgi:hypothetical protein